VSVGGFTAIVLVVEDERYACIERSPDLREQGF
jgi:hypothetical protein